jgi:hypothetical protein
MAKAEAGSLPACIERDAPERLQDANLLLYEELVVDRGACKTEVENVAAPAVAPMATHTAGAYTGVRRWNQAQPRFCFM